MVMGARANTKKAGGLGSTGGLFLDLSLPRLSRSEGSASRPLEVKLDAMALLRVVCLVTLIAYLSRHVSQACQWRPHSDSRI